MRRRPPNAPRHHRSGAHNARILTFEATVTYPFHPLNGQSVLVVGEHQFADVPHLIIRKPDGSAYYLPAWMVSEYAGTIRILARPRLPVDCLFELRLLADRLIGLSSGDEIIPGGQDNEAIADTAVRSVHATTAHVRVDGRSAHHSNEAAGSAADRSYRRARSQRRGRRQPGGGR